VDAGLRLGRHLRRAGSTAHVVVMVMMHGDCGLQRVLLDFPCERRRGSESDAQDKRAEAERGSVIHVASIKTAKPAITNIEAPYAGFCSNNEGEFGKSRGRAVKQWAEYINSR
jgi:hypothetical protein